MKKLLFLVSFIFLYFFGYSKNKISARFYFSQLDSNMVDKTYAYQWVVNSKAITNVSDTFELEIHYPLFDTVVLKRKGYKDRTIITRFETNKTYELRPLTYFYDIDIFDSERTINYQNTLSQRNSHNYAIDSNWVCEQCGLYDSTAFKAETGNVKFKLKNHNKKECVGGTYGRIRGNFTNGMLLDHHKTVLASEPLWTRYSGYCFSINIGAGNKRKEHKIYEDSRNLMFCIDDQDTFVFSEEYVSFEYRFLNRETLIVTYDAKNKTASLKLGN